MFTAVPLVQETRGGLLDLTHFGHIAVVDEHSRLVYSAGDPSAVVFYRSASKPIQALPVFARRLDEKYGVTPEESVIFAASHAGEPFHVAALESIFKKAGFMDVGMDHFVDPADSLAIALSQGLLHRNFQGYCTRATTGEVYAFGSSGISQLDNAYLQNVHESRKYVELVEANAMTEIRCEELSYEERVIRDVIERLMCNRRLAVSDEEKRVVGAGWDRLLDLEKDKLIVKKSENEMEATELGTLVIRYLAMQLDPLMRNAQREGVFSKTI